LFRRSKVFLTANCHPIRAFFMRQRKEQIMKKLLIAATAAATLIAVPAAAEDVFVGADRSGVGVQVGPVGVGVGPRFGWDDGYRYRHRHYGHDGYYAYGSADCRTIRERTVTPSGRVIVQTKRICD
jgi:hypothetical protein